MNLLTIFSRPHPFIFNRSSVLVVFLATFFILAFLSPFGYGSLPLGAQLLLAAGNSVVAAAGVWSMVALVRKFLPNWSSPDNWTVGKEIVLILLGLLWIIILIFFFLLVLDMSDLGFGQLFTHVVLKTLLISTFPIILMVLIEQYSHQRKKLRQALSINEQLKSKRPSESARQGCETCSIKSDNGQVELQLFLQELVFVRSEGNYLEVYFFQQQLKRKLVRNSLKALVEQLPTPPFFHCHKSFLVNLEHVVSVAGNARSLSLYLRHGEEAVPVSRSKSRELQQLLQQAQG